MNRIKNYIYASILTLSFSLSLILGACHDKESTVSPSVKLVKTEFTIPNSGGTDTLSIQTDIPLEVVSADESWCTVKKVDEAASDIVKYCIIATQNTANKARQTTIHINGSGYSSEVIINQAAEDLLKITNESTNYQCPQNGGKFTITLVAKEKFTTSISNNWISEIEKTDSTFQFSVYKNLGEVRTGSITFKCGYTTATFAVSQDAYVNNTGNEYAKVVAQNLGLGWNLGNQLDSHSNGISNETVWGNMATTQDAFNNIAATGIKSVRIPVTWLGHIGNAPNYTIDAAWMNRVAEVVNYAETAGLNAIINIHHDGANSNFWLDIKNAATSATVNNQIKGQIKAIWTQIAEKFKNKGHFLIFESLNEIHDGGWGWGANRSDGGKQYAVLNEWNQVFVDAVRATGGNNSDRYLGIPGYCTNPDLTINNLNLPNDPANNRLMIAVHYYDPYEYTLENTYSEWGHTGAVSKKPNYGDESYMKTMFGKLKSTYMDKGIPVYIGEFGSVHRSNDRAESFRKYYLEYFCKAAKTFGMAPFYWDNGSTGAGKECSGLLNHATGNYINNGKDIIDLMINAISNTNASYTLETVYNGAPL